MFKKKCPACGKKLDRKFNYCGFCGFAFKKYQQEDNFGMLGKNDFIEQENTEEFQGIKMPFGMDKILNSLVKQLEKQFQEMDEETHQTMPKGFRIQISSGRPRVQQVVQPKRIRETKNVQRISEKETERRASLPRTDAESKVRRLGDRIIYEISAPGIKGKEDVMITKLEEGIEVKAYSKDKCYIKVIPLKIEVIEFYIKDEKLFVEFRG